MSKVLNTPVILGDFRATDGATHNCQKPGLRERQRKNRDEAILRSALALIMESGYDDLTMEALAERVEISRPTLYNHFSCKEHLVLNALLMLVEEGTQSIQQIDRGLPAIHRLEHVVRWMMEIRFTPTRSALVKMSPALLPLKSHPDYLCAFDRRTNAIAEIIEDAQRDGDIAPELASKVIVQILLAQVCDANYETLVDSGQSTVSQIVESVTTHFLRGIRPNSDVSHCGEGI
jgi:AcrR family transcriptional regulator